MATRLDQSNHTVFSNLSASYAQVGQYRDALREANMCISLKPDWPKGYTRKGLACYYIGSYDDALTSYTKAVELDPENSQLQEKLEEMTSLVAERKSTETKGGEGAVPAQVAKKKDEDLGTPEEQIQVLVTMMQQFVDEWDFEQCLTVRDKIYELQKESGAKVGPVKLEAARASSAPAAPATAPAPAPAASPSKSNKKKKGNKKQQQEASKPAEDKAPPPKLAPVKKAAPPPAEEDSSDEETEEEKAARAEALKKRAEAMKNKGNEALKAGNIEKAISSYSMAIRLVPTEETFYSNRSAAYLKDKDFKNALTDGNKCVELAPQWGKGYTRQGAAFYSLKMMNSALKSYQKAHDLEPDNPATKKQLDDVAEHAKNSKYTLEQEEEWLHADNREQIKKEACGQQ